MKGVRGEEMEGWEGEKWLPGDDGRWAMWAEGVKYLRLAGIRWPSCVLPPSWHSTD